MKQSKTRAFSKLLNTVNESELPLVDQHANLLLEFKDLVYVGCEPFQPEDLVVDCTKDQTTITGKFGFDCFTNHSITYLIGRESFTVTAIKDIPEEVHNFTAFNFDLTHDRTFTFCFLDSNGQRHKRHQSIHSDRRPWVPVMRDLMKRETR